MDSGLFVAIMLSKVSKFVKSVAICLFLSQKFNFGACIGLRADTASGWRNVMQFKVLRGTGEREYPYIQWRRKTMLRCS